VQLQPISTGHRHHQYLGLACTGDAGDPSGQAVTGGADAGNRVTGRGRQRHRQRSSRRPRRQPLDRVGVPGVQQCDGSQYGAGQKRHRRDDSADLLHHDGRLTGTRARAAELLGDQQAGHPQFGRQRMPDTGKVLRRSIVDACYRFRWAPVGEQAAHAVPQCFFGVGVQQIAHLSKSLNAMSLSTRCSGGRPRMRSAMVLRRISEVPPSIELPFARR